jgi:hypothetical protein
MLKNFISTFNDLSPLRKSRVKRYGVLSSLLLVTYLVIAVYAILNQNHSILAFAAGIGLLLSVTAVVFLFSLYLKAANSGDKNNLLYIIFAFFLCFLPLIPLVLLSVAGHRRNDSIFRVGAGVVIFFHTILFNTLLFTFFDPELTEDAQFVSLYFIYFLAVLSILGRFIKYLPSKKLLAIYRFLKLEDK